MKVKFTGKRTGRSAIRVLGHGIVQVGDVLDLPAARARTFATAYPEGADWELVTDAPKKKAATSAGGKD